MVSKHVDSPLRPASGFGVGKTECVAIEFEFLFKEAFKVRLGEAWAF